MAKKTDQNPRVSHSTTMTLTCASRAMAESQCLVGRVKNQYRQVP